MRVLVAPDKFAGTLTAGEAAEAIATGWKRQAPSDVISTLAMSDGGPGFIDVLHRALGGDLKPATVRGSLGDRTAVTVLHVGDTAYVESAQACGQRGDAWTTSTVGVGQAITAALDAGAKTIVVGLGGSGTNDGGAGLLSALGATADVALDAGPRQLAGVTHVDLSSALERMGSARLVAAADVDVPLLGMFGATRTFGPQKGLSDEDVPIVDRLLDEFVNATCGREPADRRVAETPGAGAAGGLGFALLLLGAELRRGVDVVAELVGLADACGTNDLVITGEGTFDHTSRAGKTVHGVASIATAAARPCIVLAGQVTVGTREQRAMGVDGAYSVADTVGLAAAFEEPSAALAALAERVARTWSRAR